MKREIRYLIQYARKRFGKDINKKILYEIMESLEVQCEKDLVVVFSPALDTGITFPKKCTYQTKLSELKEPQYLLLANLAILNIFNSQVEFQKFIDTHNTLEEKPTVLV